MSSGGTSRAPVGGTSRARAGGASRAPVVVLAAFAAIATVLVLIGAQRPSEPPPVVTIERAGTPDDPRPVTVIMRDYRFDPTPVVLVPGETVRLTVFNAGLVEHELTLGDEVVQAAWSRADAAATPPHALATAPPASVPPGTAGLRVLMASGDRLVVDYEVPRDQELALVCHLPGHVERGMVGAVELRAFEPADDGTLAAARARSARGTEATGASKMDIHTKE